MLAYENSKMKELLPIKKQSSEALEAHRIQFMKSPELFK
jgi:hypothetical protein